MPLTAVGLFGKKLAMTQYACDRSHSIATFVPATAVEIGANQVTQIKTVQTSGYGALQVAYNEVKPRVLSKSCFGKLRKAGSSRFFKNFGEFRVAQPEKYRIGECLDVRLFHPGQPVTVVAPGSGKGFLGTVKRHNFSRGPMTHGSKNHRLPGSIGSGTTPGRVYPGKKMAGRSSGRSRVRSTVLETDENNNIVLLRGSAPGKRGHFLKISAEK
uniref:Large ribosomal subunit protein uL3c n=1 Tax=Karenia brevis TaxID=156230 RepID=A0A0S2QDC5_KARBR|nr:ribosomal protein L3 [Karenia brevis]